MPATLLAQMFAQKLAGPGIQQPHTNAVPLHGHSLADPSWRGAVVSGFHFHAAVQMNRSVAVLVVAEWLERKRLQGSFLFGEHGRDLTLRSAVNPRVGPALFPMVQIGLRFDQAFKALPFERRLLGMADP